MICNLESKDDNSRITEIFILIMLVNSHNNW